eukprot:CAMPEP_0117420508 /NCGR_PEP_ID=MMETSP0758-20121206/1828_1 /TAXON_ID=63605 /ORGANISM="Percolomonas cosmopolitus, Strain AE-1 (ATCC 50343)" /LENGTH=261 /DNA_ID=CAMNT_0005202159 /DNA_START=26 /DNA_END=811 /DNA_ORIENTATION=-
MNTKNLLEDAPKPFSVINKDEKVTKYLTLASKDEENRRKGDGPVVTVFGGSILYTGAPYFASMSALRTGTEMTFVICEKSAGIPIKSYTPDIMVAPLVHENMHYQNFHLTVDRIIKRSRSIIIGPGMGRDPLMMDAASKVVEKALKLAKPILFDADGIHFFCNMKDELLQAKVLSYPNGVVLTPNQGEIMKLCTTFEVSSLYQLSLKLPNCFIVMKGVHDEIMFNGYRLTIENRLENQCKSKRFGGLGDVLSGVIGCYLAS